MDTAVFLSKNCNKQIATREEALKKEGSMCHSAALWEVT